MYYFLKKHTQGEAVDIDLEEVAGTATTAAANGSTPATPKKGSSRSKGAKKEKKVCTCTNNIETYPVDKYLILLMYTINKNRLNI